MNLLNHKAEWDELGKSDALWAILSDPERKYGGWDEEAFFTTGEREIESVIERIVKLGFSGPYGSALDFGCGVGRLTRALASRFDTVTGVDVSDAMIEKAKAMHATYPNCTFLVNPQEDLRIFPDGRFNLIYSNIVLQHLPSVEMILRYVREFIRLLAPGGIAVFQLPSKLPFLLRLQPRRTLFRLLRSLGVSDRTLYWRLGLHPISMRHVPRDEMVSFLTTSGGSLMNVQTVRDDYFPVESSIYYVTKSMQ